MRPDAEPWWRQALADLDAAQKNLGIGLAFAASWFAQQAAEKSLKALYIDRHGALPRRTHDLEYLGTEVQTSPAIQTELEYLNPAFDVVRYPDGGSGRAPVEQVTLAAAAQDVISAERVTEWVRIELRA